MSDKDYFSGRHVELTDLNREDRRILRPIVGACLAGALAFVLVFGLVKCAIAEETRRFSMESPTGKLVLDTKECSVGGWFAKWKSASWFYRGKPYEACWSVQEGVVVVIDSAGIVSAIPRELFKREEGI